MELLGPSVFVYGDHELYHTFLGVEHLKSKSKSPTSSTKSSVNPDLKVSVSGSMSLGVVSVET